MSRVHARRLWRAIAAGVLPAAALLALPAGAAAADEVLSFFSPPNVQGTYVPSATIETFNTDPGASWAMGSVVGTVNNLDPDEFGGACRTDATAMNPIQCQGTFSAPQTKYAAVEGGNEAVLTLSTPAKYLGFWWSAGDDCNSVELFNGANLIGTFTTATVNKVLAADEVITVGGTEYQTADYKGDGSYNNGENFAYIHLFAQGSLEFTSFRMFQTSGCGTFEFDNVAVAASATIDDSLIAARDRTDKLTLVKAAEQTEYARVGQVIDYTFTVTNEGTDPLGGPVVIDDPLTSDEVCPKVRTVGNLDNAFDPGETIVCRGTYTVTRLDLDAGSVENTATASAPKDPDGDPTERITSDESTVIVPAAEPREEITLRKLSETKEFAAEEGFTIRYRFIVRNTGNVPVRGPIAIDDPMLWGWACPDVTRLYPGERVACEGSYVTDAGDVDREIVVNTATATAVGRGDGEVRSLPATARVPMARTYAVLLDRSGSMDQRKFRTLVRYNATLRWWQERSDISPYYLNLFSTRGYAERVQGRPIEDVNPLTRKTFAPGGRTNFYDSATRAIEDLLARGPVGEVVFLIISDGRDNASTSATEASLAELIAQVSDDEGWRFLFRGRGTRGLDAAVAALR